MDDNDDVDDDEDSCRVKQNIENFYRISYSQNVSLIMEESVYAKP